MVRPPRPPGTPSKNVQGLTDPEFDGVGTPDLRVWLSHWCDEKRSEDKARTLGLNRRVEIRRLQAEINARYDAGRARKPAQDC